MKQTCDVLVIGAGYIGCAVSYHLVAAGLDTVLIDRRAAGSQASLKNYGNIQIQDAEVDHSLPMVTAGAARFEQLEEQLGYPIGYRQLGSLLVIDTDDQWQVMQARLTALHSAGIAVEMIPAEYLSEVEPLLDHTTFLGASYHLHEGQIDPAAMTKAYISAGTDLGLRFKSHTEVVGFDLAGGEIVTVKTSRGDICPSRVVLCTGAWTPQLGLLLDQHWAIQHIHDRALTTQKSELRLRNHVTSAAIFQEMGTADLEAVLAVSQTPQGSFLLGEVGAVTSSFREAPSQQGQQAILKLVSKHMPELASIPILRDWSTLVAFTRDGLPLLGPVADIPNLILATAFKSTAVSTPVVGEIVTDLIVAGESQMNLECFSPIRKL